MAFFSKKTEETFGLDVDETSVRMVQLQHDSKGYTVVGAARSDLATAANSTDLRQVTVNALRQGMDKSGISSRHAVAGIGGDDVSLRCFEFPALDKKELSQAIQLDAEQSSPFELDASVMDYHMHPVADNQVKGVTATAQNNTIAEKQQLIHDSGLSCALMDVNDLALLNCFNETETLEENQSAIILNIGSTISNLIVVRHGFDPFFRNISHGQSQFVTELAAEHEETPAGIQKILFESSKAGKSPVNLSVSLSRICQPLISDVSETIRYYQVQHKIDSLGRILICGDFSMASNFCDILEAHLPVPIERWNPFTKMRCPKTAPFNDLLSHSGSALVVAAGLAMRSI